MTVQHTDVMTEPAPVEAEVIEVAENQLRRRRDDFANSRIMFDMVRFLMTKPSSDQVAQQLVLGLMNEHASKGAVISVFEQDGTLRVIGSFGMTPLALKACSDLSLWDASPMTDALRHGEPVILPTAEAVEQRYPWLGNQQSPHEPLATWPLTLPSERIGAVQVIFSQSPDPQRLRADVAGVAAILALYFSLVGRRPAGDGMGMDAVRGNGHGNGHATGSGNGHGSGSTTRSADVDDARTVRALSDRQTMILGLMAKGLTNGQIAARVGFSESTVRQETMAIYRFLNVGGRHEAVRIAGLRGMLEASHDARDRDRLDRDRLDRDRNARASGERPGMERPGLERPGLERPGMERPGMERLAHDRLVTERAMHERMDRMMPGPRA